MLFDQLKNIIYGVNNLKKMNPIDLLMEEHELISKMVQLFDKEIARLKAGNGDHCFIHSAIDFFSSYGDKTHHGKEEDILFREIGQKPISEENRNMMGILLEEHIMAREKIKHLNELNEKLIQGDKSVQPELITALEDLGSFYLQHIEKENTHFFIDAKQYFNDEEWGLMIKEFAEFDRSMIHEKYRALIAELEAKN